MHLQYYDSLPHHYCVQPLDHFSASRAQWSLLAAVATDSNHMQKKKKIRQAVSTGPSINFNAISLAHSWIDSQPVPVETTEIQS